VVLFIAFTSWVLYRRAQKKKRSREEQDTYTDVEAIFRSETGRGAGRRSDGSPIPQQPSAMRSIDALSPPPTALIREPLAWRVVGVNPFADSVDGSDDRGQAVFPPIKRKPVGGSVDPFQDPETEVVINRRSVDSDRQSSVREFHTTPSWVVDQKARLQSKDGKAILGSDLERQSGSVT
jgi:hypothetical protein